MTFLTKNTIFYEKQQNNVRKAYINIKEHSLLWTRPRLPVM